MPEHYNPVLISRYAPEGADAVAAKIDYLQKTLKPAETSTYATSSTAAKNKAFPDCSTGYFCMTAVALYQ